MIDLILSLSPAQLGALALSALCIGMSKSGVILLMIVPLMA